jgi:excisionase family DNA binding protein
VSASRGGEPEFLSVNDVATRLNVSGETIRRWASEGQLPAIRVGRQWRIYPHELDRFLARAVQSDVSENGVWEPGHRSQLSDPDHAA